MMRILIIDDEPNIRRTTEVVLQTSLFETAQAADSASAKRMLETEPFDAALLDLRLGGENGLEVLQDLVKLYPNLAVVVFTAHASVETAVEAMKLGAKDYVQKPFTPDELRQVFYRIQKMHKLERRVSELETRILQENPGIESETRDSNVRRIYELADKVAISPASVLILGESGTGKTELARRIHRTSDRKERPFVLVHCPSLSRELLESELFGHIKGSFTGATADTVGKVFTADGGTLFLDEIGELPLELQSKLLRLIQDREYERVGDTKVRKADVRIIAATNRKLEESIKTGQFREDLYYRLNVMPLEMPPLRHRPLDLEEIAKTQLQFFSRQMQKKIKGFSPEVYQALRSYSWPGNIRELRNAIEHAVILASGDFIQMEDLSEQLRRNNQSENAEIQVGSLISLEDLEKQHIRLVLQKASTLENASQCLGIDPATLYRKRKRYGLD
jgi:two-component system, NtrC family, response regulator AlgB